MELAAARLDRIPGFEAPFQFRQSRPNVQMPDVQMPGKAEACAGRDTSGMDKIAGLREILALDPKNSFARYGVAMELAGRGETAAALEEFDTLLKDDPDYTAGYFMAAQTLAKAGRGTPRRLSG
jgi:predicted Zn-dependent protease